MEFLSERQKLIFGLFKADKIALFFCYKTVVYDVNSVFKKGKYVVTKNTKYCMLAIADVGCHRLFLYEGLDNFKPEAGYL